MDTFLPIDCLVHGVPCRKSNIPHNDAGEGVFPVGYVGIGDTQGLKRFEESVMHMTVDSLKCMQMNCWIKLQTGMGRSEQLR